MVITRAGRVQEWSQGELRLHMKMQVVPITVMIFFHLIFCMYSTAKLLGIKLYYIKILLFYFFAVYAGNAVYNLT